MVETTQETETETDSIWWANNRDGRRSTAEVWGESYKM